MSTRKSKSRPTYYCHACRADDRKIVSVEERRGMQLGCMGSVPWVTFSCGHSTNFIDWPHGWQG